MQVSFPGGHLEPGEDAIGAALRETREEIGDSLGEIEVLGTCQTLPAGRCGVVCRLPLQFSKSKPDRLAGVEMSPQCGIITSAVKFLSRGGFSLMWDVCHVTAKTILNTPVCFVGMRVI